MRWPLSLPRLAITVWLAWLMLVGLMFGMQARQVWNPHFLPMMALLVILVAAGLSLIVGGTWRLLRGPFRRQALACILLGAAPLWFMTGHAMYGLVIAFGRNLRFDLPLKMLVPLGGSLMDIEARIRYPQWTTGEKVTMISIPVANARERVAAMDGHVRQLEKRLGRTTAWPIRWVRGPLLGLDGKAPFSVCMGSRPHDAELGTDGLAAVDRHEVAHCVITSLNSYESDPPAVLAEGWAEANQGTDSTEQVFRAWERRVRGDDLTLRELTGPDWYWCHRPPAYIQGAPLVNFILREFGPERFLSLYTGCAQKTINEDCQRILGVNLDELDEAFWTDVERTVKQHGPPDRWRLERLKLDPKVDAAAWKTFLADYLAAADRLLAPYEHARTTAEYRFTTTDGHGEATTFCRTIRSVRSGAARSLWIKTEDKEEIYLAHPSGSLEAHRKRPTDPWEIQDDPKRSLDRSYRRIRDSIEHLDFQFEVPRTLLSQVDNLKNRVDPESFVVAAFERFIKDGRPLVRVRLEDRSKYEDVPWRAITLVLASDQLFAAQSFEVETLRDGKPTNRGAVDYDQHNGVPVLRGFHSTGIARDGKNTTASLTILERRFEPIAEEEFTSERVLMGPAVHKVVHPGPSLPESTALAKWSWLPLASGAASLVVGVVISFLCMLAHPPGRPDQGSFRPGS